MLQRSAAATRPRAHARPGPAAAPPLLEVGAPRRAPRAARCHSAGRAAPRALPPDVGNGTAGDAAAAAVAPPPAEPVPGGGDAPPPPPPGPRRPRRAVQLPPPAAVAAALDAERAAALDALAREHPHLGEPALIGYYWEGLRRSGALRHDGPLTRGYRQPAFLRQYPVPPGYAFNYNSFMGGLDPLKGKYYVPRALVPTFLRELAAAARRGHKLCLSENYHKRAYRCGARGVQTVVAAEEGRVCPLCLLSRAQRPAVRSALTCGATLAAPWPWRRSDPVSNSLPTRPPTQNNPAGTSRSWTLTGPCRWSSCWRRCRASPRSWRRRPPRRTGSARRRRRSCPCARPTRWAPMQQRALCRHGQGPAAGAHCAGARAPPPPASC
jgi:hypothetical protein